MNRLSVYKYQLHEYKASLIAFFAILLCLMIILGVMLAAVVPGTPANFSGFEFSAFVFLFVVGIVTFKDPFFMMIQNGVTRKTLFTGELAAMGTIAIIATLYNKILLVIFSLFTTGIASMDTVYNELFYQGENTNTLSMFIGSIFLEICISLLAIMGGYMIRIIFYRLNRFGKILVGAGLPILFFFAIPILDYTLLNGAITKTFSAFLYIIFESTVRTFATLLIAFALCSCISYLLMRRATIK